MVQTVLHSEAAQ